MGAKPISSVASTLSLALQSIVLRVCERRNSELLTEQLNLVYWGECIRTKSKPAHGNLATAPQPPPFSLYPNHCPSKTRCAKIRDTVVSLGRLLMLSKTVGPTNDDRRRVLLLRSRSVIVSAAGHVPQERVSRLVGNGKVFSLRRHASVENLDLLYRQCHQHNAPSFPHDGPYTASQKAGAATGSIKKNMPPTVQNSHQATGSIKIPPSYRFFKNPTKLPALQKSHQSRDT